MAEPYYEIRLNGTWLSSAGDPNGVISPIVDKEINTAGSCTFTVLPDCSRYSEFKIMTCYIDVLVYGQYVFHGRVREMKTDFYKQISVTCEGALAFLKDAYARVWGNFRLAYSDLDRIFTTDEYLAYADQVEAAKDIQLAQGCIEPDYDDGNLIPESAFVDGYIDNTGALVPQYGMKCCSEYLQLENGKQYRLVIPKLYDRTFASLHPIYLAEYTGTASNPTFQQIVTLNQETLYTSNGRLVRPFIEQNYDLWLAKVTDAELHEEDANIITNFSDYISEKVIDWRGMMVRLVYDGNYNFFEVLHPKRTWHAKKFTFAENILSLEQNNRQMDIMYSILIATFKGKTGGSDFTQVQPITYEIPGAVAKFGKVYHTVDFAIDSAPTDETSSAYQDIIKKLKQYADIYNPIVPNEITLKGLDPAIFDRNGEVIEVGDPVIVESSPHGVSITKICLNMKLDLINPQNNEYKIGEYIKDGDDNRIKSLTAAFAKEKKKKK